MPKPMGRGGAALRATEPQENRAAIVGALEQNPTQPELWLQLAIHLTHGGDVLPTYDCQHGVVELPLVLALSQPQDQLQEQRKPSPTGTRPTIPASTPKKRTAGDAAPHHRGPKRVAACAMGPLECLAEAIVRDAWGSVVTARSLQLAALLMEGQQFHAAVNTSVVAKASAHTTTEPRACSSSEPSPLVSPRPVGVVEALGGDTQPALLTFHGGSAHHPFAMTPSMWTADTFPWLAHQQQQAVEGQPTTSVGGGSRWHMDVLVAMAGAVFVFEHLQRSSAVKTTTLSSQFRALEWGTERSLALFHLARVQTMFDAAFCIASPSDARRRLAQDKDGAASAYAVPMHGELWTPQMCLAQVLPGKTATAGGSLSMPHHHGNATVAMDHVLHDAALLFMRITIAALKAAPMHVPPEPARPAPAILPSHRSLSTDIEACCVAVGNQWPWLLHQGDEDDGSRCETEQQSHCLSIAALTELYYLTVCRSAVWSCQQSHGEGGTRGGSTAAVRRDGGLLPLLLRPLRSALERLSGDRSNKATAFGGSIERHHSICPSNCNSCPSSPLVDQVSGVSLALLGAGLMLPKGRSQAKPKLGAGRPCEKLMEGRLLLARYVLLLAQMLLDGSPLPSVTSSATEPKRGLASSLHCLECLLRIATAVGHQRLVVQLSDDVSKLRTASERGGGDTAATGAVMRGAVAHLHPSLVPLQELVLGVAADPDGAGSGRETLADAPIPPAVLFLRSSTAMLVANRNLFASIVPSHQIAERPSEPKLRSLDERPTVPPADGCNGISATVPLVALLTRYVSLEPADPRGLIALARALCSNEEEVAIGKEDQAGGRRVVRRQALMLMALQSVAIGRRTLSTACGGDEQPPRWCSALRDEVFGAAPPDEDGGVGCSNAAGSTAYCGWDALRDAMLFAVDCPSAKEGKRHAVAGRALLLQYVLGVLEVMALSSIAQWMSPWQELQLPPHLDGSHETHSPRSVLPPLNRVEVIVRAVLHAQKLTDDYAASPSCDADSRRCASREQAMLVSAAAVFVLPPPWPSLSGEMASLYALLHRIMVEHGVCVVEVCHVGSGAGAVTAARSDGSVGATPIRWTLEEVVRRRAASLMESRQASFGDFAKQPL